MTSIERTAYPYISASKSISQKILETCYTLIEEELAYINKYIRGNKLRFYFAIQLKAFQNLGYFVGISDVPQAILNHLKKQTGVPHNLKPGYEHQKTLSRHRISIRNYLKVTPWSRQGNNSGQRIALQAAYNASQTMNNPADIINIVIEDLIAKHFELPAYNTLDRLVQHARATVNRGIFHKVTHILKNKDLLKILDQFLITKDNESYSDYQKLKQSPKAPTITNFKELIRHHSWLMSLGDMKPYLQEITKVKLKQFAEEARSLDVSNLRDLSDAKKYTLIVCLIYQAQQLTKDALATLFCKTLSSIHKRAKRELDELRRQFADKTQDLAYLMLEMVGDFKDYASKPKIFTSHFKEKLEAQGGVEQIMDICQTIIAYNSKNGCDTVLEIKDYF
ncbi:hypothetical protein IM40_09745 (plasmid) [Candidatus Paracaedimonas acanthamoebae]|nr:hypothetical protein IM40_09745 [Candidatus Paracaedimonas acanthamoebae]